jgi:hypothetical protein
MLLNYILLAAKLFFPQILLFSEKILVNVMSLAALRFFPKKLAAKV